MAGQMFSSWMAKRPTVTNKDLTEAQITERNRSNPLGGYGFMSAREKNQITQQQDLQAQMMQDEQDYAVAQLSPNQQINLAMKQSGRGLGQAIGGFMQRGQPQQQVQDDPALARFNQLAQQLGPSQAKIMLGQELMAQGNPAGSQMILDGQKELQEADKANYESERNWQQVDQSNAEAPSWGFEHKPGFSRKVDDVGPNGEPYEYTETLLQNTADGGIWKRTKAAPKGSTVDTVAGFRMTKNDASKEYVDFKNRLIASANVVDQINVLTDAAKANPDALTGTAGVATWLDNAARDIGAGARALSGRDEKTPKVLDLGQGKYKTLNPDDYSGLFERMRIDNAKIKSQLMELTYDIISIEQGSGARPTDSDFRETLKQLGGNLRDPKAFATVLESKIDSTFIKLDNAAEFNQQIDKEGNRVPFSKVFENEIKSVKGRRRKAASGNTVLMIGPDGKTRPIPAERVDEAKSHGYKPSGQ